MNTQIRFFLPGLALAWMAWAPFTKAAPLPVGLLASELHATNELGRSYSEFGRVSALSGDWAAVGLYQGVDLYHREGEGWQYQGRLSQPRPSDFGYSVDLDGDTLAVGYSPRSGPQEVQIYVRTGQAGLNAWQIRDEILEGGQLKYEQTPTPDQQAQAGTNGWRLRMEARVLEDFNRQEASMGIRYGDGTTHYEALLKLTAAKELAVVLAGASPQEHLLTSDADEIDAYHEHEIVFDPGTGMATYYFDGAPIHTWGGLSSSLQGVAWGGLPQLSMGIVNFHRIDWTIEGADTPAVAYDAGPGGNPRLAPDPVTQGWSQIGEREQELAFGPQSPDPTTTWDLQAAVSSPGAVRWDSFGRGIALQGNILVAGAPFKNDGSGAAYVFERVGTNWVERDSLDRSVSSTDDQFGSGVAVDGDTVLVGAPNRTFNASSPGRVFAYVRDGDTWPQQGLPLTATDGVNSDAFGTSVAVEGDLAVVGARADDHSGINYAGSAYVFERIGASWTQRQKLIADPASSASEFGWTVDISGSGILVGAVRSATWYLFTLNGNDWVLSRSSFLAQPNPYDPSVHSVQIDGERFIVAGNGFESEGGGAAEILGPDFSDAAAVNTFVGGLLDYQEAATVAGASPATAAFRYKDLLYAQEGPEVRPRFERMQDFYGDAERQQAAEAEQFLLRGLAFNPGDGALGHRLLDLYYDRAVAETIVAGNLQELAFKARFGGTLSPPPTGGGFYIDHEIPIYRELLATNRFVLDQYLSLLNLSLTTRSIPGAELRWASEVLDVSSEWVPADPTWNAIQTLGEPDTYPDYGDIATAWASATPDDQREFLELGYANPAPANRVDIYETLAPGGVDMVSLRNANSGAWETVWTGSAAPAGNTSRIFSVTFPLTAYPVDGVRIDIDSPAVPSWQEIDAVGLVGPEGQESMMLTNFGYDLFRTLVPGRAKMAATYTNSAGEAVSVTTNSPVLFSGYKDLVLLFDLLRDRARTATELGRLLAARRGPGDEEEVRQWVSDTQRYLFLQGNLLQSLFPEPPPPGDPSGLAEVIAGWQAGIESLIDLEQTLLGDANILGFAPDFLMLIENFQTTTNTFDSYDIFKIWLEPEGTDSPLRRALEDLEDGRSLYSQFRGYEDQVREQYDQSTISYEFRLFEIVGARPGEPNYLDAPTTNPGSELDQQFRSIEAAHLRIKRNKVEISNLQKEVNIELAKAAALSNVFVAYGEERASIEETIGHINAAQAGMDALADAFSPEKLAKAPLVIFGIANAAVQAGGEEWKGQLNADKERLAAMEQAEIQGIESEARVKALLLGMATLQVDSQMAGLELQQELARLTGLYREKGELEARLAERNADLSSRYFADPIHRIVAETNLIQANLSFGEAQKWLFFMARALEYKWNLPFLGFEYPSGSGRFWSTETLFKLRNAEELEGFYEAMVEFNRPINRGRTFRFDWFSVRDDFMELSPAGGPYIDPLTGAELDGISLFRTNLLRRVQSFQGGEQIVLEFNTVRQIPGGFFFVGPVFDLQGNVINKGRFLDKIDYLQIRLPGSHSLGRSQLAGNLTYSGTSFIRNFNVGQFDPDRPDELVGEMTSYSTRYWFYDPSQGQMRWRFNEGLTIDSVEMELSPDPRVPPTATRIEEFKERSVAATGWKLTIPLVQQGVQVLDIDELDDVEIYFHHYSAQRQ